MPMVALAGTSEKRGGSMVAEEGLEDPTHGL